MHRVEALIFAVIAFGDGDEGVIRSRSDHEDGLRRGGQPGARAAMQAVGDLYESRAGFGMFRRPA